MVDVGGGAGRAWSEDEGEDLPDRAALLGALIESAPMAILAVSPERRVLAANRRFEQLLAAITAAAGDPDDVCERVLSALAADRADDVAVLASARGPVE